MSSFRWHLVCKSANSPNCRHLVEAYCGTTDTVRERPHHRDIGPLFW